jgi:hypothetical protein
MTLPCWGKLSCQAAWSWVSQTCGAATTAPCTVGKTRTWLKGWGARGSNPEPMD